MNLEELVIRLQKAGVEVPPNGYLTERQVMSFLPNATTANTLRKWRNAGCGPPASKFGNKWYYEIEVFAKWLTSGGDAATKKHDVLAKKPRR